MKTKQKIMAIWIAMSLPLGLFAQDGLFQRGNKEESYQEARLFRNEETWLSLTNQTFGNSMEGADVTNQTFGTPLGGGLLIMLVASAGYATCKSNKRKNDNNK